MQRILRPAAFAIAVTSAFAAAVIALLPALVWAAVTLFYDSAGGVLIFLGSLLSLLPHPVSGSGDGGSLPLFQRLTTDPSAVLLRSVLATGLSFAAAMVLVASGRRQGARVWLTVGGLCLLAAFAGGNGVAITLVPAVAISLVAGILTGRVSNRDE